MSTRGGPRPSHGPEHWHADSWTKDDHNRYEDRVTRELESLERAVHHLTVRITMMLGALTLIAVLLPVIAPFIRGWLNVDPPTGQ